MTRDEERPRPKRKAIPLRTKRLVGERQGGVCKCGCGLPVWDENGRANVQFDHEPALRLRDVNEDWTDYVPAQHDPKYIDARCPASHHRKTHGSGSGTAGTDIGKIAKERKRLKRATRVTRKRVWPRVKLRSRPFQKRVL